MNEHGKFVLGTQNDMNIDSLTESNLVSFIAILIFEGRSYN